MKISIRKLSTALLMFFVSMFAAGSAHAYNWFVSCEDINNVDFADQILVNSTYEPVDNLSLEAIADIRALASGACVQQATDYYRTQCATLDRAGYVYYRVGRRLLGYTGFNYNSVSYTIYVTALGSIPVANFCPANSGGTVPGNRPCRKCGT